MGLVVLQCQNRFAVQNNNIPAVAFSPLIALKDNMLHLDQPVKLMIRQNCKTVALFSISPDKLAY